MGLLVISVVAGAFLARRRLHRALLMAAVWAVPAGLLIDLQWWLHQYGRDLDPTAPFRLDPFTPKVIGTTIVINFHTETMVAAGFWVMVAAGLVITVGPWAIRFVRDSWSNTGAATAAMALLVMTAMAGTLLLPAARTAEAAGEQVSITAAIAAAAPGDTIHIPAGTYVERLVIDKSVILVGEGRPVIDGGGLGDVIHVVATDVTIRGFDVRNSARAVFDEPSGIRVSADRATLEDNRLTEVLYGIALENSNGHIVRANSITSMSDMAPERRGHGLYLWYTTGNQVIDNVIHHVKDGIFLGFAEHTVLEGNVVTQVRYGIHTMYAHHLVLRDNVFRDNVAGASLMYSRGLLVTGNEFSGNRSAASGYGLLFKDMDDVELVGNRIFNNRLGLTMDGAPRTPGAYVTFRGNLIAYNQVALDIFTTVDATFTENSFVGNLQQVETRGGSLLQRNAWSLDGRGNYWDDYRGFDASGDGIGDIPYRYEGIYDQLVQRNASVRAYSFTPARSALDLAARWFPVYRAEPRVVDSHPLMSPSITFADSADRGISLPSAAMNIVLVVGATGIFVLGRRAFGKIT
jgi:nitrous oxidase accessory protein